MTTVGRHTIGLEAMSHLLARPIPLQLVHGPMGCGKSELAIHLVKALRADAHDVHCLVAGTKERRSIRSRSGERIEAHTVSSVLDSQTRNNPAPGIVVVDEAQFLTEREVHYLANLATREKFEVMCFGLLWQAQGPMFDAVETLIYCGAILRPIPHNLACWCGAPAVADGLVPASAQTHAAKYRNVCIAHKPRER